MARCLGADPPYGCKHFKEHQEAARKGWLTRRHGPAFRGTEEHRALSKLFGSPVEAAHEHPEHRGQVRFKHEGKWYELPKGEFKRLVGEGRKLEREEAREQRHAEKERTQEERYRAAQERQVKAARKAEYQSVVKRIRQLGGIRPYKGGHEAEEFRDLPRAVKTRDTRRGVALDDAAATLHEEMPWLRIENDTDLQRYLEKEHRNQKYGMKRGKAV